MAQSATNLLELSFDEINAMKKKDLVSEIEKLKGKVVVDINIKNLCDQVSRLSENLAKLMESNEKLSSQFIVVKKVNTLLEKRVIELEKSQAKAEQYSSGIFSQVFCLGAVVTIKVSENGSLVKIYHENDLKIYQNDGNASVSE